MVSAQETFGADGFSVLSIGFDTSEDTPGPHARLCQRTRHRFRQLAVRQFHAAMWLSACRKAWGSSSFPSPKGFDHLAQTTIRGQRRQGLCACLRRRLFAAGFGGAAQAAGLRHQRLARRASAASLSGSASSARPTIRAVTATSSTSRYSSALSSAGSACLGVALDPGTQCAAHLGPGPLCMMVERGAS